jgi:hypothetical protein
MKKWAAAGLAAVLALGAVAPAFADNGNRGNRQHRGNHYGWYKHNGQCNAYNRRNDRDNDNDNDNDDNRGYSNGRYNNGSYNGGYNNGGYNTGCCSNNSGYYNGGYYNGGYYNGGYNNGGYNNGGYSNGGYSNSGYNNGNCYNGGQYGRSANARIFGTIVWVDGNHVVLQTGSRRVDVDDQPALDNQSSGRVSVGRSLTAYGYWQGNVFYATRMV